MEYNILSYMIKYPIRCNGKSPLKIYHILESDIPSDRIECQI